MYRLTVFEEYDENWVKDFKTLEEAKNYYNNSKYFYNMPFEIIAFEIIEIRRNKMKLSDLFMVWWIFGYTWKVFLELWNQMWEEKYKIGHFKFTWF